MNSLLTIINFYLLSLKIYLWVLIFSYHLIYQSRNCVFLAWVSSILLLILAFAEKLCQDLTRTWILQLKNFFALCWIWHLLKMGRYFYQKHKWYLLHAVTAIWFGFPAFANILSNIWYFSQLFPSIDVRNQFYTKKKRLNVKCIF